MLIFSFRASVFYSNTPRYEIKSLTLMEAFFNGIEIIAKKKAPSGICRKGP